MNIELGYFPKSYYSSKPNAGGFFPFAIDDEINYVFDITGFYLSEYNDEFIPLWMNNIKAFPIYFCSEIPHFWQEKFEQDCTTSNIQYNCIRSDKERSIFISEIKREEQLKLIFPFYLSLGASNELVVWSSNKNVFSLDKREWIGNLEGDIRETVIVKMEADSSVFWIGYDGDSIVIISNQLQFSTYEKIAQTFPKFVSVNRCDYGEA